jgi:hypothetical protein
MWVCVSQLLYKIRATVRCKPMTGIVDVIASLVTVLSISVSFSHELNLGSARRSRTSQETSERSGARQVRSEEGRS